MKGKTIAIALINAEQNFFRIQSGEFHSNTEGLLMECGSSLIQNPPCCIATLTHAQMAHVRPKT
jgi:hypothetical protein